MKKNNDGRNSIRRKKKKFCTWTIKWISYTHQPNTHIYNQPHKQNSRISLWRTWNKALLYYVQFNWVLMQTLELMQSPWRFPTVFSRPQKWKSNEWAKWNEQTSEQIECFKVILKCEKKRNSESSISLSVSRFGWLLCIHAIGCFRLSKSELATLEKKKYEEKKHTVFPFWLWYKL